VCSIRTLCNDDEADKKYKLSVVGSALMKLVGVSRHVGAGQLRHIVI
jgi:hypothetical protein